MPSVNISVVALIAANTVLLAGLLFRGWDAAFVIIVYWAENGVIGFYNILKMVWCRADKPLAQIFKFFLIPFFVFHYGTFWAGHGVFVYALTDRMCKSRIPWWSVVWPLAALIGSHGVSFVRNYLGEGEYLRTNMQQLMRAPYARVLVLHVGLLTAGIPIMALGSPVPLAVLLVVSKIVLDIKCHNKSHARLSEQAQESESRNAPGGTGET